MIQMRGNCYEASFAEWTVKQNETNLFKPFDQGSANANLCWRCPGISATHIHLWLRSQLARLSAEAT